MATKPHTMTYLLSYVPCNGVTSEIDLRVPQWLPVEGPLVVSGIVNVEAKEPECMIQRTRDRFLPSTAPQVDAPQS